MGASSGARTVKLSVAPGCFSAFLVISCCPMFSFLCSVLEKLEYTAIEISTTTHNAMVIDGVNMASETRIVISFKNAVTYTVDTN